MAVLNLEEIIFTLDQNDRSTYRWNFTDPRNRPVFAGNLNAPRSKPCMARFFDHDGASLTTGPSKKFYLRNFWLTLCIYIHILSFNRDT